MMGSLARRIVALEAATSDDLPAAVKQWLGWPLTESELAAIEAGEGAETDWDYSTDTSDWTPELKQWLGMN